MSHRHTLTSLLANTTKVLHFSRGQTWECLVYNGWKDKNGYARCKHLGKTWRVSRLVWMMTHGEEPQFFACHICDNPPCIDITHLYDGTHQQNVDDSIRNGRHTSQRSDITIKRIRVLQTVDCREKMRLAMINSLAHQQSCADPEHRRNISKAIRRITLEEVALMVKLRADGLTFKTIAAQLGYSTHGIQRAIQVYAKELIPPHKSS